MPEPDVKVETDQPVTAAERAGSDDADRMVQKMFQRAKELQGTGMSRGRAHGIADLEFRIAQWPSGWGDDLVVLIYGDFEAPGRQLDFPSLGITVEAEKAEGTIVKAITVLKARVKIPEKSVAALLDAARRVELLLGVSAVLGWGNGGSGWWSYVTHGSIGGVAPAFEPDRIPAVVEAISKLPPEVARKLRAAMYWIREPRQMVLERHKPDILRVYAGYWNAFECLVEAVCKFRPQTKKTRTEKQKGIDDFLAARDGKLDAAAVNECYRAFVDPGFVAKASHALRVCFGEQAEGYISECFRMKPEQDRLYNIRNAINHGDIEAENLEELIRVEDRQHRLWMIVFGMVGRMIPISCPVDPGPR